ncbi:MAG: hypothetical protein AAF600_02685 [Bacteroidota bacterium]
MNRKYWQDGNANKQYLDYLELQESRKAATTARKQSSWSIGIALLAIVVSSLLGLYSINSAPKPIQPPYDVKIIEDRSGADELNKENDSLRNRLYEANILIEGYEDLPLFVQRLN